MKIAATIAVLLFAIVLGSGTTLAIYCGYYGEPKSYVGALALPIITLTFLCETYAVMGENLIEDAVKSTICSLIGFVGICAGLPLLGVSLICASLFALVVNQGVKLVWRTRVV